jgi:hypothetical protein
MYNLRQKEIELHKNLFINASQTDISEKQVIYPCYYSVSPRATKRLFVKTKGLLFFFIPEKIGYRERLAVPPITIRAPRATKRSSL